MRGTYDLFMDMIIGAAKDADVSPRSIPLPSLTQFAAFVWILSQAQTIIELVARKPLRKFRTEAYGTTVKSRGYATDWWIKGYLPEREGPPAKEPRARFAKKPLSRRVQDKIFKTFLLRCTLLVRHLFPLVLHTDSSFVVQFFCCPSTLSLSSHSSWLRTCSHSITLNNS